MRLRPVFSAALAAAAVAGLAAAPARQNPPAPQPQNPVFRGRVDLVTLDVTVIDKNGMPVVGLTQDDFTVTVAGEPRPIRALDFVSFGAGAQTIGSGAPAMETSNRTGAVTSNRGGRAILFLFDDLSYEPGQGKGFLVSAQRLLANLGADDRVGLFTTSGTGPVVAPTPDRAKLDAAFHDKKLVGQDASSVGDYYVSLDEAIQIERSFPASTLGDVVARECGSTGGELCATLVEARARALSASLADRVARQMLAYRAAIDALRVLPPPRILIALTAGVEPNTDPDGDRKALDDISRAAAAAEVQFYAIADATNQGVDLSKACRESGSGSGAGACEVERRTARKRESDILLGGIDNIVSAAGGELLRSIGQPDRMLRRALDETSGLYRLGIEAGESSPPGKYLDVKVAVKRPDVRVLANRHALVPGADTTVLSPDQALEAKLGEGGASFGVPITLATARRRAPSGGAPEDLQVGVNIQIAASAPGPLLARYTLLSSTGQLMRAGRQQLTAPGEGQDYRFAFAVPVGAGSYQLRFAVADANGNIGSVERTISGTLAHFGSLSVSDLFTTWAGEDGRPQFLALERLPAQAKTVRVNLEIYPDHPAAAGDVAVRLDVTKSGESDAIATHDFTPVATNGVLSVSGSIPFGDFEPSTYVVRATVFVGSDPVGSVVQYVRKIE